MQKIYTIYTITNKVNGKIYVGYTTQSIQKRFQDHVNESNRTPKYKIHRAILKYGRENFIIEQIYQTLDKKDVNEKEEYFIKEYKTQNDMYGYNIANGGQGGNIKTKEQLQKQSIQWKENNIINVIKEDPIKWESWLIKRKNSAKKVLSNDNWLKQNELNKQRFIENNPGKNKSEETKKRQSEAQKKRNIEITITPCILFYKEEQKVFLSRKEMEVYCIKNNIPRWSLFRTNTSACGMYKVIWLDQKRIGKFQLFALTETSLDNESLLQIIDGLKPTTMNLQTFDAQPTP